MAYNCLRQKCESHLWLLFSSFHIYLDTRYDWWLSLKCFIHLSCPLHFQILNFSPPAHCNHLHIVFLLPVSPLHPPNWCNKPKYDHDTGVSSFKLAFHQGIASSNFSQSYLGSCFFYFFFLKDHFPSNLQLDQNLFIL